MEDARYRARKHHGVPMATTALDLESVSADAVMFQQYVEEAKIEVIGLGFHHAATSVAPTTPAVVRLQKDPAEAGATVEYTEPTQLLTFPAAGVTAPKTTYVDLNANKSGNSGYDLEAKVDYPTFVRDDVVQIALETQGVDGTQTGWPFYTYRELLGTGGQEGPT